MFIYVHTCISSSKIIYWLKDYYEEEKHLLLPPFQPNATLPQEVLDAYQTVKDAMMVNSAEPDSLLPSEVNVLGISNHDLVTNSQFKILSADHAGFYESKSAQSNATRSVDSSVASLIRITEATGFTFPTVRTIDQFPVEKALANHVGVDITEAGLKAEKRRGVTVIIHGSALSGRTTQAKALASYYDGAVLDIDSVLIEAISSATTEAGVKARTLCYEAMTVKSADSIEATNLGVNLGPKKQPSLTKDKEKEQQQADPISCLKPPSLFKVKPHMDMPYKVPEATLMPLLLPEEIIVEILANRFLEPDCLKAVVIDGIESSFSSLSVQLILKAFNNRTHIYFVHLGIEFPVIKERQEEINRQKLMKIRKEQERKKEAEQREEQRIIALLELEEDEYEALTEEQQEEIDVIRLKRKKARRLKKQKEKQEKLRLEREKKEEEERLREEEKLKKKGKKDKKPPPAKPLPLHGANTVSSRSGSVASTSGNIPIPSPGLPASHSGASLGSGQESPSNIATNTATPKHTKVKRKASPKPAGQTELESDSCIVEKTYSNYKLGLDSLRAVLEDWDRHKGITRKPIEPEEQKATPVKRGKTLRIKEHEPTIQDAILESEETREGIGVPLIDIDGNQSESDIYAKILNSGLPSYEEILTGFGLGPSGTPIPSPVTLQVCPFPLKRAPVKQESDMFCFMTTSPDDP